MDICCRCTLELPLWGDSNVYQQHVTEIKETYFEIYTKQVSCPLALPLLNISNCQSVLNTCHYNIMAKSLYLHDINITKFDFVNYDFAKLVVAWL